MAGTPIRRARKLGLPVPNIGDRPPGGGEPSGIPARTPEPGKAEMRAARKAARPPKPPAPPTDPERMERAKVILMDIAEYGQNESARVGAARAILEGLKPTAAQNAGPSVGLHIHVTPEAAMAFSKPTQTIDTVSEGALPGGGTEH